MEANKSNNAKRMGSLVITRLPGRSVKIGDEIIITVRVLQQYRFDGYRASQSVQDKARIAGNGHSLAKIRNAVLDALACSLRACQKAVIHVVAPFVKGATIPCKARLVANRFLTRCIHQTYIAGVLIPIDVLAHVFVLAHHVKWILQDSLKVE